MRSNLRFQAGKFSEFEDRESAGCQHYPVIVRGCQWRSDVAGSQWPGIAPLKSQL